MSKKNYYLTLDTETATLPFINEIAETAKDKQKICIAKPLVYDIGWTISDRKGEIIKKVSYLIQETFFVPNVFNTAYYKSKRPLYLERLERGEMEVKTWNKAMEELQKDLQNVTISTAYNACFDFKKAIPFTERYIKNLYSPHYNDWEKWQKQKCIDILEGNNTDKNDDYLIGTFKLRDREYPICDLWGIACKQLLNNQKYKRYCMQNGRLSASGLYFSTSAETVFQYLTNSSDFVEEHTALSDAIIECQILTKALKKCGVTSEIVAFPFRELGETSDFVIKTHSKKYAKLLIDILYQYLQNYKGNSRFATQIENQITKIENIL